MCVECVHCRLLSNPAADSSENFRRHLPSPQSSAAHDAADFSSSSLPQRPQRVGSANQSHRSSYYDSPSPMSTSRNAKLSNGRLGSVSPYDVGHHPSPGWSQHWDNATPPAVNDAAAQAAAPIAVNLPMRRHLAHIPLNAVTDRFLPNDQFRYSYREQPVPPPPSMFHRIVSLPTRHQRRNVAAVPARSAQV